MKVGCCGTKIRLCGEGVEKNLIKQFFFEICREISDEYPIKIGEDILLTSLRL
jgi:hypothetical protein